MDPSALIPTPDAIPVHWSWFKLLLLVTFFLHILLMNAMLGSAFIAMTAHLTGDGKSTPATEAIAEKLPFFIAFAVNFGVAPLLFVQVLYGHFIYSSSILMGTFWLWIIGILIGAYYLAYIYKYRYDSMEAGRAVITGVITFLLLLIGFFFSNNFTLMLHPESWVRYFDSPGGMLLNLDDPTLLPRYLHFMVSAVAVGGITTALYHRYRKSRGADDAVPWIAYGCRWFAYATFVNAGVGAWFAGSLPQDIFPEGSTAGFFFFLLLLLGFSSAVIAAIFALREKTVPAFSGLLITLVLMILARDMLRSAYLAPWFSPSELTVQPAYSPFIIFLASFIGGLVLIGWMVKKTFESLSNKEVQS